MTLTAWCWICWPRLLYSSCSPCPPTGVCTHDGFSRRPWARPAAPWPWHPETRGTESKRFKSTCPRTETRTPRGRTNHGRSLLNVSRSPPTSSLRVPRRVFSVLSMCAQQFQAGPVPEARRLSRIRAAHRDGDVRRPAANLTRKTEIKFAYVCVLSHFFLSPCADTFCFSRIPLRLRFMPDEFICMAFDGDAVEKVLRWGLGNLLFLNDARMESERGKKTGADTAQLPGGRVFCLCALRSPFGGISSLSLCQSGRQQMWNRRVKWPF